MDSWRVTRLRANGAMKFRNTFLRKVSGEAKNGTRSATLSKGINMDSSSRIMVNAKCESSERWPSTKNCATNSEFLSV